MKTLKKLIYSFIKLNCLAFFSYVVVSVILKVYADPIILQAAYAEYNEIIVNMSFWLHEKFPDFFIYFDPFSTIITHIYFGIQIISCLFLRIIYNLIIVPDYFWIAPLAVGIYLFFKPVKGFRPYWSAVFALRSTLVFFILFLKQWLSVPTLIALDMTNTHIYTESGVALWSDIKCFKDAHVTPLFLKYVPTYYEQTQLIFNMEISPARLQEPNFFSDFLMYLSELILDKQIFTGYYLSEPAIPVIGLFEEPELLHYDGWFCLSMVFVGLTTFIFPLCIMSNWDFFKVASASEIKIYLCSLIFLEYFIIQAFTTKNIFFFYMFFESTLLPMILLIGIWGPTPRKIKASYYLVFYTLGGSILFLFAILVIIVEQGTADMEQLIILGPVKSLRLQLFLWCCVSLAFAVKMPIFPFHIWLPEAHVEAPTVGSVILAALLLKLGGYGFIRFIPIFPYAYVYFMPLMYTLGVISIIYASLITIRQIDLKKIIAYSSVAHMNLGTIGIFSLNLQGLQGSIFLMVSHGVVSSALFFLVGMLYARKSSKLLDYYGGLVTKMPIFTMFFFFFSLANLAFPGTANFVGELLILIGVSESNISIMILGASGMLFSSLYSIWLFNRLCFGHPKVKYDSYNSDMTRLEFYYMFPLFFVALVLGIYPSWLLEYTEMSMRLLLQYLKIN